LEKPQDPGPDSIPSSSCWEDFCHPVFDTIPDCANANDNSATNAAGLIIRIRGGGDDSDDSGSDGDSTRSDESPAPVPAEAKKKPFIRRGSGGSSSSSSSSSSSKDSSPVTPKKKLLDDVYSNKGLLSSDDDTSDCSDKKMAAVEHPLKPFVCPDPLTTESEESDDDIEVVGFKPAAPRNKTNSGDESDTIVDVTPVQVKLTSHSSSANATHQQLASSTGSVSTSTQRQQQASTRFVSTSIPAPKAPQVNTNMIWWPDFKEEIPNKSFAELSKKNWICVRLESQLAMFHPKSNHISQTDNARDQSVLRDYLEAYYPTGRPFASYHQLVNTVKKFGEAWGFEVSDHGKKISCSLGHQDPNRNVKNKTMKDKINCPFYVKYTIKGWSEKMRKEGHNMLQFECKITGANYQHTCGCSTVSHRIARTVAHRSIPKREALVDIIKMFRTSPDMQNQELREHLRTVLPSHQSLSATKLAHIRRSLLTEILKAREPGCDDLDQLQGNLDGSITPVFKQFSELADDPATNVAYRELLRSSMQDTGEGWKVVRYLKDTQALIPGFVYKIREDEHGAPIGVLWMTPGMRRTAVMYGDNVCLDAQKRQMNTHGWVYIGPTFKDGNFKPRVGSESLHVQEDKATYAWVILTMMELENRFGPHVKIIFGDEGISGALPGMVGINAIVCGDNYHLLKEVWLKHFGAFLYPFVLPFLKTMFNSRTKEEFDMAHEKAQSLTGIRSRPCHIEYLEAIHQNPTRYGGYVRRNIPGNMEMNGSVSAEQNHSSITQRIGSGGLVPLTENIMKLLQRQADIIRDEEVESMKYYKLRGSFTSHYQEPDCAEIDVAAFRTLTPYAYEKAQNILKAYRRLEWTKPNELLATVYIYPSYMSVETVKELSMSEAKQNPNIRVMHESDACDCPMKICYGVQCAHELALACCFQPEKWATRWYNKYALEDLGRVFDWKKGGSTQLTSTPSPSFFYNPPSTGYPSLPSTTGVVGTPGRGGHDSTVAIQDSPGQLLQYSINSPECVGAQRHLSMNYSEMLELSKELCRAVQNDPFGKIAVHRALTTMTKLVREQERLFEVVVVAGASQDRDPVAGVTLTSAISRRPVSATSRPITNTHAIHRKRSSAESGGGGGSGRTTKSIRRISLESDRHHAGGKQRHYGKSCSLCKETGHQIGTCPKITKYGVVPVSNQRDISKELRSSLVTSLNQKESYVSLVRAGEHAALTVYDSLPANHVKGLVMHQRLIKSFSGSLLQSNRPGNYCFLCTVLGSKGDPHVRYEKCLFELVAVTKYILKSNSQILLNQMILGPPSPLELARSPAGIPEMADINAGGGALGALSLAPSSPLAPAQAIGEWQFSIGSVQRASDNRPITYDVNGNPFGRF